VAGGIRFNTSAHIFDRITTFGNHLQTHASTTTTTTTTTKLPPTKKHINIDIDIYIDMSMAKPITEVLNDLALPETLKDRVFVSRDEAVGGDKSFVLYLPTVVIRYEHNPALALACRLANHYEVPLVILHTVPDDAHHPLHKVYPDAVVATARRHAFILQALQKAATEWQEKTGAAVYVRVHHGPQTRTPHHLTLARQAMVAVMDEPFVQPYKSYVRSVEKAAQSACVRVDGSTTVPPRCFLTQPDSDPDYLVGLPPKAFMWKDKTKAALKGQVNSVVKDGHFDAPVLTRKCDTATIAKDSEHPLRKYLPAEWFDASVPAPSMRAWVVNDLNAIVPEEWVIQTPGIDVSVPVSKQAHGARGWDRWTYFRDNGGLAQYAKQRGNAALPHAPSRLSFYLNLGTISIYRIVSEMWERSYSTWKFQDEIVKWREMAYAHAISHPGYSYFEPTILPEWSIRWLDLQQSTGKPDYSLADLAQCKTDEPTWNAMQSYLCHTGELHNNARMTWGKTLVHWQAAEGATKLMHQMSYLNDRFALDGLSPPSYAGLSWCLGWCDKPGSRGTISAKPSSRYRLSADGFAKAQKELLKLSTAQKSIATMLAESASTTRKRGSAEMEVTKPISRAKRPSTRVATKALTSFFPLVKP
jgi:hypothetical protein